MKPLAHNRIRRQHDAAKYQFVITELDLAITFGEIALSSGDQRKAERNAENAKRAHSSAQRFLRDAHFDEKMGREVNYRLAHIARLLQLLENRPQHD